MVDRYERYRQMALQGGSNVIEVEEAIALMTREDECLDRSECPRCGGRVTDRVDVRQAGISMDAGKPGRVWINYRCEKPYETCGFGLDRLEDRRI